jgi:hypothetical protein
MVFGDCDLAVGDAPDKAKVIAHATNGHSKKHKKAEEEPAAEAPPQGEN